MLDGSPVYCCKIDKVIPGSRERDLISTPCIIHIFVLHQIVLPRSKPGISRNCQDRASESQK